MYKFEKRSTIHDRFINPSFSSTLLDQIYRSIDEGETKLTTETTKFYREQKPTVINKPTTDRKYYNYEPKTEKLVTVVKETNNNRKSNQRDHDQDALFFSSTSISSDSSSSGFSSSDTDSLYRTKSRSSSCFVPPRPKPVRTSTSASFRFEKEKHGNHVFDDFCPSSETKQGTETRGEEVILIKNKSRAVKIYNNLKKVKQPISPGGKLTSFLNSLFANSNNEKKTKTEKPTKTKKQMNTWETHEGKVVSTCSSASSFSRSCLSKTASFCGRNDYKTVRFCGVEEGRAKVEEATRKFLNEYHSRNKMKKKDDLVLLKDLCINQNEEEDEDDDDVASCASSDLFELDHLSVFGDSRYCEELPVYGTTRVS